MTEAIERMARALDMFLTHSIERDTLACDLTPAELNEAARAALLALREPTPAQIDAFVARALQVKIGSGFAWSDYARLQWTGMIDAAAGHDAAKGEG